MKCILNCLFYIFVVPRYTKRIIDESHKRMYRCWGPRYWPCLPIRRSFRTISRPSWIASVQRLIWLASIRPTRICRQRRVSANRSVCCGVWKVMMFMVMVIMVTPRLWQWGAVARRVVRARGAAASSPPACPRLNSI